jgi:hypothetical protein
LNWKLAVILKNPKDLDFSIPILVKILYSRRVSDEVFDHIFFGILELAEDGVTATKSVGLKQNYQNLIVFEVLNESDFDFPFKSSFELTRRESL